jgi:hypothetical protein
MNPCRRDPLATDAGGDESLCRFWKGGQAGGADMSFLRQWNSWSSGPLSRKQEARMASHWHTADGPSEIRHDDDIGYYGGWTISGLVVVATITAVWLFGI